MIQAGTWQETPFPILRKTVFVWCLVLGVRLKFCERPCLFYFHFSLTLWRDWSRQTPPFPSSDVKMQCLFLLSGWGGLCSWFLLMWISISLFLCDLLLLEIRREMGLNVMGLEKRLAKPVIAQFRYKKAAVISLQSLLFSSLDNSALVSLSSYGRYSNPWTILLALCWTHSNCE